MLEHPLTWSIVAAILVFGLVALVGIFIDSVSIAVSALAVVGFGVLAFVRHIDARRVESQMQTLHEIGRYAEVMRDRTRECVARYNALLATGDERVKHYFNEVYVQAAAEHAAAEETLARAAADRAAVSSVERRIFSMAERLVQDHLKWSAQKLRPDPENYQRRKQELESAFDFVKSVGYPLPSAIRNTALTDLKRNYSEVVRVNALKEQQRRIQQQMREEEKLRREAEEAIREAEESESQIQQRLDAALRQQRGTHDVEVQLLRQQLAEAQARAERAKSMAQLTKVGHVYILSNIGSFGTGVYKVGMTRRLEPDDRVRELGDASVPFPFDVHAMISCDNAPALEHALHHELTRYRVNRVNLRKEYFRIELNRIIDCVRKHHGKIEYEAEPEALEFRESQEITPEDVVETEAELEEMGVVFEEYEE
ncbi:MAG: GIY-YIG nuclease family protein [Planctomycetaceae bacterium]|nr:GIY-YIG nuclease family protein [Planctomycetaceae bacterium]